MALGITGLVLTRPEGIVQKGYGWILKEENRKYPDEVFSNIM